jgi:hypothetical protein
MRMARLVAGARSAASQEEEQAEIRRLRERVQFLYRTIEGLTGVLRTVGERAGLPPPTVVVPRLREPVPAPVVPAPPPPIASESWWPLGGTPETPLVPAPGNASFALTDATVTAVSVFGRRGADLDRIVGTISERQRDTQNMLPVFLTDSSDFDAFKRRGFIFEYFPEEVYGSGEMRRRNARTIARLRLLELKWNFAATIHLDAAEPADAAATSPRNVIDLPRRGEAAASPGRTSRKKGPSARKAGDGRMKESSSPQPGRGKAAAVSDKDVELVRASGLFDEAWYLERYPDVAAAGIDPVRHYLETGAAEGRDPSPLFNTRFYAGQMAADSEAAGSKA